MSFIDPKFIGGFFGFMDSEFLKCPYCEEMIARENLKKLFNSDKNCIICPFCKAQVGVNKLKNCLE